MYETELAEASKTMKSILKKEKIRSTLPKKSNQDGSYRFSIGDTSGYFKFHNNYIECYRMHTPHGLTTPQYEYVTLYLKEVAKETNASLVLMKTFNQKTKQIFVDSGYFDRDYFSDIIDTTATLIYSPQHKELMKHKPVISSLQSYLEQLKKKRQSFRYAVVPGSFLWGYKYYYKGYKGLFYLKSEDGKLLLKEDTLELSLNIDSNKPLETQFQTLFDATYEYTKLENLVKPNNKIIIERLRKEGIGFQAYENVANTLFDKLLDIMPFEEIEERAVKSTFHRNKYNYTPIYIAYFLDHYIVYHDYAKDKEVHIFNNNEKEEAYETFISLSMEEYKDDLESSLERFTSDVDSE